MVLITEESIFSSYRNRHIAVIQKSLDNCEPQSIAFIHKILGEELAKEVGIPSENNDQQALYGGYPEIARLGFMLDNPIYLNDQNRMNFIDGIKRLMQRTRIGLEELISDDIALLGIAIGISSLSRVSTNFCNEKNWALSLIDKVPSNRIWTFRARDLAGDLLDNRGRLRVSPMESNLDSQSLELCLRSIWPQLFPSNLNLLKGTKQMILGLFSQGVGESADIEKASVKLKAIELLTYSLLNELEGKNFLNGLELLNNIKYRLDSLAEKRTKIYLWLIFILYVLLVTGLIVMTLLFGWNTMEPWITFIGGGLGLMGLLSYLVVAIINKKFNPVELRNMFYELNKKRVYQNFNFDIDIYGYLSNPSNVL